MLSGSTTLDGLIGVVQSLPTDRPGPSAFDAGLEQRTGFERLSRDGAEVDAQVADPVGGPGGANVTALGEGYRAVGLRDVVVHLCPGARHELVDETTRDEVTADVVAWLEAHLPG